MAREFKIGIVVIGVLLVVFCGLLMKRLARPSKLPLANSSSSASANSSSATAKATTPPLRPTLVTPQAETANLLDKNWAANLGQSSRGDSDWTKPHDRYGINPLPANENGENQASSPLNAAAPHLLAAPLPIQDLEGRSSGAAAKIVPYQTGYAGATDGQNAKTTPPPLETTPVADPFQRAPAFAAQPTASVEPASSSRDRDSATADRGRSATLQNHREEFGSPHPAPTPSMTKHFDARPVQAIVPKRYSQTFEGSVPSQTHLLPGSTPSYSGGSPAAATGSQRSAATMTGVVALPESTATIERDGEKYAVQPNDTFWSISEKAYGTGAFFKALYEYNRKRHKQADELVVGQELLVPEEGVLRRAYPDLSPRPRKTVASTQQRLISVSGKLRGSGRVYTVVEGDTLFEIARYELGKPSRWAEIYELNRDVLGDDFDYLRPGAELILPDDLPRDDNVTRHPEQLAPGNPSRY